jgi:hypothetical protein
MPNISHLLTMDNSVNFDTPYFYNINLFPFPEQKLPLKEANDSFSCTLSFPFEIWLEKVLLWKRFIRFDYFF